METTQQQPVEQPDYSAFRPLIFWGGILLIAIIMCSILVFMKILNVIPAMVVIGGLAIFILAIMFGPR